jgi:Tfp pilus assembly protein PilF
MTGSMLDAAFTFASHDDWPRVVSSARQALASEPENASAHALLALALAQVGQTGEAVEVGRRAVALGPEMAFAHYAHGWALLEHDDAGGAERAAREALRLQPGADEYGLLAYVRARQLRWQEALDAATRGLDDDPEHECCRNFRALALTNLGQNETASQAVRQALAGAPDDAYLHANRGWLLLRESRTAEALDCFRAALRLDAEMEWARLGLIEAMKAQNPVYRLVLRYSMWRSTLGTTGLAIGVFLTVFGGRLAYESYSRTPSLWPWLLPVGAACGLFLFGPWIVDPLSNLVLRHSRAGRLPLNPGESLAARLTGVCLGIAAVAGAAFQATRWEFWPALGTVGAVMLVPIGGLSKAYGTRAWPSLSTAAVVIAGGGAWTVLLSLVAPYRTHELLASSILVLAVWSCLARYVITKYV